MTALAVSATAARPSATGEASAYATIRSINVSKVAGATCVDFTLDAKTIASLATTSTQVNITFTNTRPSPNLASNIQMDNTLGRLAVSGLTGEANSTRVSISLNSPMDATLQRVGSDDNLIRVYLLPAGSAQPVVSMVGSAVQSLGANSTERNVAADKPVAENSPRLYDLDAFGSDAAVLFKSLATQSNTNIVLVGGVSGKVTVHFARLPIDRAIDLLTKAAGLSYVHDGDAYVVGSQRDLAAEYPSQTAGYQTIEKIYDCKYVDAAALAGSLLTVYNKNSLHITIGAIERTTTMLGSSAGQSVGGGMAGGSPSGYGGGSASPAPIGGGSSPTPSSPGTGAGSIGSSSTNTGRESREVILSGEQSLVDQAYALAEQLDRRRKQVKIDVNITDVSLDDLKDLGIQWTFPQFGVHEGTPHGISFGSFRRDPLNFEATISALMDKNKAKLLAAPSISLLDGEQGYILIGQRVSYPLLTGYTQAQTPIFSVGQEQVGIYLQVKAQMTGENEIMLSVYPQVSFITGYLNVNGASYPQVSTREQQTTIRVQSGGKVVIGGLINDEDIHDEQSVPFLSKIPLFGELFKYRNMHKTRDEVIMTITPQVIPD